MYWKNDYEWNYRRSSLYIISGSSNDQPSNHASVRGILRLFDIVGLTCYRYYYYYSIDKNILVYPTVISCHDHRLDRNVDGHKVRGGIITSQRDVCYAFTARQHEADWSVNVIYPSKYGLGDRWYYCETIHYHDIIYKDRIKIL